MSAPPANRPARIIGRYALHDEIASGGMATVHLGQLVGTAGFSRTVAIKRLHVHLAKDPEFVSMLLDEARIVARIRHLNVVPMLDVVTAEDEVFLVMEYVQGESLGRLLRAAQSSGERLPIGVVVSTMVGVLHGLHAAHEAKSERGESLEIVHRDVSPQNILIGVDGVARVLDFGVAKATGRIQTTREGQLKGKLAYMAPEQIEGAPSRITDVYAASAVMWEALAGRRLFEAENEASVVARVLTAMVEPPSLYAPDVSKQLSEIVLRGLSRDPKTRWPTAREMARALERVGPLAPASETGELVEKLAATSLAQRSGQVADIESNSSVNARALAPVVVSTPPSGTRVASTEPSEVVATEPSASVPIALENAPGSVAASSPNPALARRSRLLVAVVTAAACALGGLAIWIAVRGNAAPPPAVEVSSVVSSPPPSAALSAPPAAVSDASAVPIATASSAAIEPPAAPSASALVASPKRSGPARSRCNPPYTVDAAGDKHYKRECLK